MFYSMEIGGGYPGQCKTGNLALYVERENTGNFAITQEKLETQEKYFDCDHQYEKYMYLFIFINFKKNY